MSFDAKLAQLTKNDADLKALDLSSSGIKDDDITKLASAFQHNDNLTALDLKNNAVTNVGVQALSAALQTNRTLTSITLAGNQVSHDALQPLAASLENNRKIMILWAKVWITCNQHHEAIKIAHQLVPYDRAGAIALFKLILSCDPSQWEVYKALADLSEEPAQQAHFLLAGADAAIEKKTISLRLNLLKLQNKSNLRLFWFADSSCSF